jgi:hypothetical protein
MAIPYFAGPRPEKDDGHVGEEIEQPCCDHEHAQSPDPPGEREAALQVRPEVHLLPRLHDAREPRKEQATGGEEVGEPVEEEEDGRTERLEEEASRGIADDVPARCQHAEDRIGLDDPGLPRDVGDHGAHRRRKKSSAEPDDDPGREDHPNLQDARERSNAHGDDGCTTGGVHPDHEAPSLEAVHHDPRDGRHEDPRQCGGRHEAAHEARGARGRKDPEAKRYGIDDVSEDRHKLALPEKEEVFRP